MASQAAKEIETPDGWDPDPVVLVSKCIRNFQFPLTYLLGDPTPEELSQWKEKDFKRSDRDERVMTILAGVTFLGTWTSCWSLRGLTDPTQARDMRGKPIPPPAKDLVLVYPPHNCGEKQFEQAPFQDPMTRQLRASEIQRGFLRVLEYWRNSEQESVRAGRAGLWTAKGGHEAPEMQILPLSEILSQSTPRGRHAYFQTMGAIKTHRDARHLGALFDYAVRDPAGGPFADAARTRSRAFKVTDL